MHKIHFSFLVSPLKECKKIPNMCRFDPYLPRFYWVTLLTKQIFFHRQGCHVYRKGFLFFRKEEGEECKLLSPLSNTACQGAQVHTHNNNKGRRRVHISKVKPGCRAREAKGKKEEESFLIQEAKIFLFFLFSTPHFVF